MKRHFGKLVVAAILLWLFCTFAIPTFHWSGGVWITTRIELTDAATGTPLSGATVSLQTEQRKEFPDAMVTSPTILSAQTDALGQAMLKEMFDAGGSNDGTGVHVGSSVVRCEANGYAPVDARLSDTGKLWFRKFLFYEQPHTVTLRLSLKRL